MFGLVQDPNGVLYTITYDNIVYAVYPNGKVKWKLQLDIDLGVINMKMGQDGTLYAYESGNNFSDPIALTSIFAISPEGVINWEIKSDNVYSRHDNHFAGDILGNFIYFSDKGLVSRNANGEINWVNEDVISRNAHELLNNFHTSKVYSDPNGNIYVNSDDKEIISIDSKGNVRWRSQPQRFLDPYTVFEPYFSDSGILYMLTKDGLYALNTTDGRNVSISSNSDLTDIQSSGIPTDGKGGYYITIRGSIQKIDYKGTSLWSYKPRETEKQGIDTYHTLITDKIGNVYFTTGSGNIIGLNSEGHEIFVFLRNAFWHKITSVLIGNNGNIYSTNMDIGLVAFGKKQIQVYSDNQSLPMSVSPFKSEGTVMVPFRSLFESLDLAVDWDPNSKTIVGTKEGLSIKLTIGSKIAYVNGEAKQLTVAPVVKNNSSYVPLRFIGEALGKNVSWDNKSSSVNIDTISTK
ncbi:stalk domain-containing protein [Paenibacillus sp. GSMTC-2017]|uniref:stalk domain-containing protein n=1 Tax=Paenibacillus sp. GSMTC-2017 TaxID=2794350 RepID=UPI001E598747|nr:stalk domain-containing protein [Paenibacillus sp. GSMTC-2017]